MLQSVFENFLQCYKLKAITFINSTLLIINKNVQTNMGTNHCTKKRSIHILNALFVFLKKL